jgi:hypothetical protein
MPTTTIKVPGTELSQALYNVALFASKDDTLPVLCGVALDYSADGVSVVATDRYTLARQDLCPDATEVTTDLPGLVTLDMATAKQLWSLKGSGYDAPTVITVDNGAVTVGCPNGMTLTCEQTAEAGYRFPNWRAVWASFVKDTDGQESGKAPARQRFTAAYIAKFAKIKGSDGYMTLTAAVRKTHSLITCGPVTVAMMQVTIPG